MSSFNQRINAKVKHAFLVVSFFATCGVSYSQVNSVVTMPNLGSPVLLAPNAASLSKYGEVPVSYYTGIPNISIPIYDIKSGSLDVPVSLSYHAGGIRVEEIASWVGLGWSLNAGGVISRQVRGVADEADGGYLQVYSSLNSFLGGNMSSADELYYFQQVERGNWDSQQDIFTYNVGGESGKFILDSSGNTLTIPSSRNKFQLINYNGTANCWKMTDIHGVQYYFANLETTQTTPVINNALSPSPSPTTITSWYLTRIVNPQGTDSINFTYSFHHIQTYTTTAQTKYLLDVSRTDDEGSLCGSKTTDSRSSSSSIYGVVGLNQITFRNGSITFTANSQPRCDLYSDNALSSIEIKNSDSSFDKIYQCYQHYTGANGAVLCDGNDETNNHLFLDSLRFSDAAGGNMGQYKFAYNTTALPSRLSYDQDYWGYYNAAGNGATFVPTIYQVDPETGGVLLLSGANRNPSGSNQAGILQSITYPTGGSTVFQYETNTASNYFSANIKGTDIVEGNRLFLIGSLPASLKIDTTFQMEDDFAGLGGVPATVSVVNGGGACAEESQFGCPLVTLYDPAGDGTAINSNTSTFLTQGTYRVTIDLSTVRDQTIINNFEFGVNWQYGASGMPTVKNNVPVGGLRIKTITDYTAGDSVADTRSYQYLFPDSTDYSSGFVLSFPEYTGSITEELGKTQDDGELEASTCVFDTYSSGSHYPMAETQGSYVGYKYVTELLGQNGQFGENIYTFQAPDLVPDLGNVWNFPYPPSTSEDWERGQSLHHQSFRYNQTSGQYELISEKISRYTPLTVADYANFQLARNTFYSGIADATGVDSYTYSMFNTVAGWTPLMNDTDRMYDQINLSAYNQKTTAYTYSNVHYQPVSITTNNSNGETTTAHMSYPLDYSGLTGTDAFTQGVVALQNSNMVTPVIERYVTRSSPTGTLIGTTQGVLTSFWSQYLLPDTVWSTQFTGPSLSFQPLTVTGGSLIRDGSYVPQLAQVRYDAHSNAVEQLKLNDMRQSYLWDYTGEYPICKVINADSADIAYTSFEADGTGNWTIGSGVLDQSTAITGKSSYNLSGNISKSGLNSSTTYIVSYWTENNTAFSVSGTISGYPVQGKTEIINGNSWTLYVHKVAGQSTVTLTGSGHIDELRLYPSTAQMTTYTYSPLAGMTSQADVGNRVTYYDYDGLGRLKRIRDQDYNVVKTFDYQYLAPGGCGSGCSILAMQTFAGTNTPGYPVGVFDVHGNLVGNATGSSSYLSLWNSDTANSRLGTLSAGSDSLHFNLSVNSGQTAPASVTGCRYYQYDLPWTELDGVTLNNGTYVDFGDGSSMHLPTTDSIGDTVAYRLAPNTTRLGFFSQFDGIYWFIHYYPDSSSKTITLYHNENAFYTGLDNATDPATSLTKVRNLRGNFPQSIQSIGGSCYQQSSALSVANVPNWASISSVTSWWAHCGDHVTPSLNLNYAQDFMAGNRNLEIINTTNLDYYQSGYWDSTFKLTRLKSNWNTYFTNLQDIEICDAHWNREDLSGLTNLSKFCLLPDNQNHSNNSTGNPNIPIPASAISNILIQIANGAGQNVSNGVIWILTGGGTGRDSTSNSAVSALDSKGWQIYIDNVQQ
jgi:YD repeat-containing protein